MNTTYTRLATVIKIDHCNPTWMVQSCGRQWHTNDKLVNPLDEDYVAIVTIDRSVQLPVAITEPLNIQVEAKTVLAHSVWCAPQQYGAQIKLWEGAAAINDPVLKSFIRDVLSDSQIMRPFYQAKASKSFHHRGPGELFLHSVEVAVNARNMAQQHALPQRIQDCVFVGGLLHDIGKILMHYNQDSADKKGINGQHEALSFMVLAEHLEKIKNQDRTLFEAVSAMLSAPVTHKKHYEYIEEAIVRSADRLSAHNNELQHVFKNKAANELYASARGGRTFRRIGQAYSISSA